jgi:hypothetical protein
VIVERSAIVSEDRRYRYSLKRWWAPGPSVCWVMLNPSTADDLKDDPTMLRVMKFSQRWGYGSCLVVNLFAFRSPNPWALLAEDDPCGPDNLTHVGLACHEAAMVVAAWGAGVPAGKWHPDIGVCAGATDHTGLVCLGTTANGSPLHPLARGRSRVPDDREPIEFDYRAWKASR